LRLPYRFVDGDDPDGLALGPDEADLLYPDLVVDPKLLLGNAAPPRKNLTPSRSRSPGQ
jgi:hypothetical protein